MARKISMKAKIKNYGYRLILVIGFLLSLLSKTVEGVEPIASLIELQGNIVPISTLSLITQGREVNSAKGSEGAISLNKVDAAGLYRNPAGNLVRSSENLESYYQTDLTIKTQISGSSSAARLVIYQMDSGPLLGLLYEADRSFDISQTKKLEPIPLFPKSKIAISNISNGQRDYQRQVILRVPASLSEGPKSAVIQYALEVSP